MYIACLYQIIIELWWTLIAVVVEQYNHLISSIYKSIKTVFTCITTTEQHLATAHIVISAKWNCFSHNFRSLDPRGKIDLQQSKTAFICKLKYDDRKITTWRRQHKARAHASWTSPSPNQYSASEYHHGDAAEAQVPPRYMYNVRCCRASRHKSAFVTLYLLFGECVVFPFHSLYSFLYIGIQFMNTQHMHRNL